MKKLIFTSVLLMMFYGLCSGQSQDDIEEIEAKEPSRLFYMPTATIMEHLNVHINVRTNVGISQEFIPQADIGMSLGGIAELYVSSLEMLTNLAQLRSNIPLGMFKVKVYDEKERVPTISIGLGLSGSIQKFSGVYMLDSSQLRYDSRFTELFIVGTKHIDLWILNAGVSIFDIRIFNFYRNNILVTQSNLTEEQANYCYAVLLGGKKLVNENTYLMVEISGKPKYRYNSQNVSIEFNSVYSILGGVRCLLNDKISIDAGAEYKSDYAGLADITVKAILNVVFSLKES